MTVPVHRRIVQQIGELLRPENVEEAREGGANFSGAQSPRR